MKTTLKVLLAASLIAGCSSTPEATEAETTATAAASVDAPPVTEATAAPTAEAAAPVPAPEPAADLVVAPVKISLDAKTVIEIKADKGVYVNTKKVATFDKNMLKLEAMDQHMVVWKDGTIESKPATPKKMKFNDKDEVEIEGGGKIAIDDRGKVTISAPDNTPAANDFKAPTVTGFKPEGRRAASLGLLLAMMSTTKLPAPKTASDSAAPKASAAPAVSITSPKK